MALTDHDKLRLLKSQIEVMMVNHAGYPYVFNELKALMSLTNFFLETQDVSDDVNVELSRTA